MKGKLFSTASMFVLKMKTVTIAGIMNVIRNKAVVLEL